MPSMNAFKKTQEFDDWLTNLKDKVGKARILAKIQSAILGNFGDAGPVGKGVSEMRIHYGPGYRVYYTKIENKIYLLLAGGDKSTQKSDITKAVKMASQI
jgi:putative addiction module killer protein